MKRFKGNKNGMTLIEVIVGLAICGIFVAIAIAVISPVMNTYSSTEQKSEAQIIGKTLMESIRGKTNTCQILKCTDDKKGIIYDKNEIKVSEDGYLEIAGDLEYDSSYYNGKTITLVTKELSTNKINAVLKVYSSKGNVLAEIDADLTPILLGSEKSGTDYSDYVFDKYNDPSEQLDALLYVIQQGFNDFYETFPEAIGVRTNPYDADRNIDLKIDGVKTNVKIMKWIAEDINNTSFYDFCYDGGTKPSDFKITLETDDYGKTTTVVYSILYKVGSRIYIIYNNENKYEVDPSQYSNGNTPFLYNENVLLSFCKCYYDVLE